VKIEPVGQWSVLRHKRHWAFAGILVALLAFAIAAVMLLSDGRSATIKLPPKKSVQEASNGSAMSLNLPPPDLLRPISPEEAMKENSERAFSGRPDTAAAAFKLKADDVSRKRALECLTQAVYYEAASEGTDGERAVAQVVLNRMRHPAYPSSVCGVVYQGSERVTGCQFTFTCDGSLARVPVPSLWKQAQKIAEQALAGKVFAPVGHATHYHADFVLPYWADSLDKSVQIGRHIFYRLKNGLGSSSAFSQKYAGSEPAPPSPATVEVALGAADNAVDPIISAPDPDALQAPGGQLVTPVEAKPQLAADASKGSLLLDGPGLAPPATDTGPAKKQQESCNTSSSSNHLRPMSANNVRSQGGKSGC
jgi:spore germination cell wall hydrolase CwlJ-like protein